MGWLRGALMFWRAILLYGCRPRWRWKRRRATGRLTTATSTRMCTVRPLFRKVRHHFLTISQSTHTRRILCSTLDPADRMLIGAWHSAGVPDSRLQAPPRSSTCSVASSRLRPGTLPRPGSTSPTPSRYLAEYAGSSAAAFWRPAPSCRQHCHKFPRGSLGDWVGL